MPLAGKPMLQWVYERARASAAAEVLIATDDERVASAARAFGAPVMMTAAAHASGTDRIAEVARRAGWGESDIVVNLQGDEPLMPSALINQVSELLTARPRAAIATLAGPIQSIEEFADPRIVKVVTAADGRALYFSRAAIPWDRDAWGTAPAAPALSAAARRHIGLYAYRVGGLRRFASLPPSRLELIEKLEQLRALENGLEIVVADACAPPGADVNTAEDLERVARQLTCGGEKS